MWYSESIIIYTGDHHQNVLKRFRHKKLGHFKVANAYKKVLFIKIEWKIIPLLKIKERKRLILFENKRVCLFLYSKKWFTRGKLKNRSY